MEIITEISAIRHKIDCWKKNNLSIGFVPTMGALHIGHESLLKKAKEECDKVVISIFVNPIQFGQNEDYTIYPRQLEKDSEICKNNNIDLIFAPTVNEMYPEQENLTIVCPHKNITDNLCGKSRIGHFDGVATVVLKLFNIVQPDKAYFGQKDAQQLFVIQKICKDLNYPVEIIPCPTYREPSGLACSSRNNYLTAEQKDIATTIYKTLMKVQELYNTGNTDAELVINTAKKVLSPELSLEYLEAYDFNEFIPSKELKKGDLVAIASKLGNVRLIDNIFIS